jgi:hypothetical protein
MGRIQYLDHILLCPPYFCPHYTTYKRGARRTLLVVHAHNSGAFHLIEHVWSVPDRRKIYTLRMCDCLGIPIPEFRNPLWCFDD